MYRSIRRKDGLLTVTDLILPWDTTPVSRTREPAAVILEGLRALATGDSDVASRAESLFMFLRKISTQQDAKEYLMGIQYLAVAGEPAGARLLAAFVDVSTPGDRLLPRVKRFSSSRRLDFRLRENGDDQGNLHLDWLDRLSDLAGRARNLVESTGSEDGGGSPAPGQEPPWPTLRDALDLLLARLSLGDDFSADDRMLLVELLRLEVDAWQERISHLAGSIHPFEVPTISRTLPVLAVADAEIRDLRQMINWIGEGCGGKEFAKPLSRSLDVLEDADRASLRKVLGHDPDLAPLAEIFEGLGKHPVPVPVLSHCLQRLQALGERLAPEGVPGAAIDLVTGVHLVQSHFTDPSQVKEFLLPLPDGFPEACRHILEDTDQPGETKAAKLAGLSVRGDSLVISIPEGGAFLEHDLPVVVPDPGEKEADEFLAWADDLNADGESASEPEGEIDPNVASISELKHLVMTNLQSISVLLGFLRSPKIVAIPGLVEEVVNRTRNPMVIETIARVRILHCGFANRGVPLACLRSPVNIPLSVLRKFIHVKFVSKVDLKRLALDKTGIRKEVGREIQKYLKSLT